MSKVLREVLEANARYAPEYHGQAMSPVPNRKFAILTCMDARMDPAKFAGLKEGDAHVVRNAGGKATDDAIRSLVMSYKFLGTQEWFVIQHTGCGLELVTEDKIRELLSSSLETATLGPDGWDEPGGGSGTLEANYVQWLTFKNLKDSVISDVHRLRNHPLVPGRIPIYGFIFDSESGELHEVPEAMEIGKTR